jgi:hypothetical protein
LEFAKLSEVKPLRWWFILSLPLFAAAIWLVFVAAATVEHNQRNAELSALVAQGSVEEATLAVRRIAHLSHPPLDLVAAAAASPSGTVAHEAQLAINDLLRRWQRQLTAGRSGRRIASQLKRLAAALDQRRDTFSTSDYAWLAKTATKIVRLANRTSPDGAPGLAAHCDSLLATANTPIGPATRPVSLNVADLVSPTAATSDGGSTGIAATSQAVAVTQIDAAAVTPRPAGIFTPPSRAGLQAIVATDNADVDEFERDIATGAAAPRQPSVAWRGRWARPLPGLIGVAPLLPPLADSRPRSLEFTSPQAAQGAPSDVDSTRSQPAESVPTRNLLERWLTADAAAAQPIERELAERGFGTLSPELVRQLFTDIVDDRVQLVRDVMITPGVDAKPWLLLLADDDVSDVRLAAVTVMATSSDPELLEKAWQVALHDRDPRLSALAERLRVRRASLGRR